MEIGTSYFGMMRPLTTGAGLPAAESDGSAPSFGVVQAAAATGPSAVPRASMDPESARLAEEKAQANVMQDKFNKECETCKNRRYQDGSDDPGVSFKTPQNIAPSNSASAVMGHEQEHVVHEQAKAEQEGGKVVSQSVRLHGAFCPECGRYYVAGGVTETKVRYGGNANKQQESHGGYEVGGVLNATA